MTHVTCFGAICQIVEISFLSLHTDNRRNASLRVMLAGTFCFLRLADDDVSSLLRHDFGFPANERLPCFFAQRATMRHMRHSLCEKSFEVLIFCLSD
jgi:hypothetical protein